MNQSHPPHRPSPSDSDSSSTHSNLSSAGSDLDYWDEDEHEDGYDQYDGENGEYEDHDVSKYPEVTLFLAIDPDETSQWFNKIITQLNSIHRPNHGIRLDIEDQNGEKDADISEIQIISLSPQPLQLDSSPPEPPSTIPAPSQH